MLRCVRQSSCHPPTFPGEPQNLLRMRMMRDEERLSSPLPVTESCRSSAETYPDAATSQMSSRNGKRHLMFHPTLFRAFTCRRMIFMNFLILTSASTFKWVQFLWSLGAAGQWAVCQWGRIQLNPFSFETPCQRRWSLEKQSLFNQNNLKKKKRKTILLLHTWFNTVADSLRFSKF